MIVDSASKEICGDILDTLICFICLFFLKKNRKVRV